MLDLTRYKHIVYDPSRSLERFLIKHIGRKKGRYSQGYDAHEAGYKPVVKKTVKPKPTRLKTPKVNNSKLTRMAKYR